MLHNVLKTMAFCLLALMFTGQSTFAGPRTGPAKQAAAIMEATGVKGGLVVHIGCGDGRFTAALHVNDSYVVHGLDADSDNVSIARRYIHSQGLYGKVSVEEFSAAWLPYADDLVNLVVSEGLGTVAMDEVMRVLAPNGVAYIRQGGRWAKMVKPWPDEIDEWTHYLHSANGNAASKDKKVGPPSRIQWSAGPKRTRDHDGLASMSAMTSSQGRIFYIYDEGPISLSYHPPKWRLVARDAFNGVPLWKREIDSWVTHLYFFRSGPVHLPRRLVSIADRVYTTLGLDAPVTALDAATGETLLTYAGSDNAEEIICHDDILLTVIGDAEVWDVEAPKVYGYWEAGVDGWPQTAKSIIAYNADTGEKLWTRSGKNLDRLVPLSLAAHNDRVYYMDSENLHCADLKTGKHIWQAACPTDGLFLRSYAPTLIAQDDVVLCLTIDELAAFSVKDGKKLWQNKGYLGFASPGDLFVIDDLAWAIPQTSAIMTGTKLDGDGKITNGIRVGADNFIGDSGQELWGIDIRTGDVKRSFTMKDVLPGGHHHRCYRNKATENYLICGRRGVELVDLKNDNHVNNWWIRGLCQYGVMPSNGLIYVPPDPCKCFNLIKVDGFLAVSAGNSLDRARASDENRLQEGPAYSQATSGSKRRRQSDIIAAKSENTAWQAPLYYRKPDEWPTYRHDITRSGSAGVDVPTDLTKKWEVDIKGRLTAAVVADNKLFVSSVDSQTLHCLDAGSGKSVWQFTARGQVDSPPTIYDGLALFGSRSGHVYCLDAATGRLVWRFRAAPVDSRIMTDGRLESVWPIHGSVLVLDGVVYFAAGRSSYTDGGISLFGLDVYSGEKLHAASLFARDSLPGEDFSDGMTGALPDVLVSDGEYINMRHVQFDRNLVQRDVAEIKTLLAPTGLLEDCWMHRINWALGYGDPIDSGAHAGVIRYTGTNSREPFGKLIVFDDKS
ncbi:MAG: PQQ-binding-like beta-propeller repeat protein, partial [Planctomycetes bacterium]|nr:PQQ-binding-like beta-propeller repeat protein [Planctomycetota bacterium]